MQISKALNLVIPIEREDGTLYVHSMPIGQEVFQRYYLVLSKAYAAIFAEGLSIVSGPRVAAMLLRDIAKASMRGQGDDGRRLNWLEGDDGIEKGLFPEIRRLSNVAVLVDGAWTTTQLETALKQGLMTAEEVSDVENQAVFFTVCSVVPPRLDRPKLLLGGASTSNSLITSLNCTEYAASLPTSTETAGSGKKATRSSAVVLAG